MLRIIQIATFTLLLTFAGQAMATLEILEEATEAAVSDTTLPAHATGSVVVRKCNGCEPMIWRVSGATGYYIGSSLNPVLLAELRAAAASGQHGMLSIFSKPGTNEVTRIVLSEAH